MLLFNDAIGLVMMTSCSTQCSRYLDSSVFITDILIQCRQNNIFTENTSFKSLSDKHGKKLTDPTDIANSLNNHFGSIGKLMTKEFDDMDSSRLKDQISDSDLIKVY